MSTGDGPAISEVVGVCISSDTDSGLPDLATSFSISVRRRAPDREWFAVHFGRFELDPHRSSFTASTRSSGVLPDGFAGLRHGTIDQLRWESDWYVVVRRGIPESALRDWDKTAYWDGQITLTPDEVWIEGRDPFAELQKSPLAKSP